jgi:dTDP-4-dehydrorhamnose 3,5-epimerase
VSEGTKDQAHIDHEWNVARDVIDGVALRDVRNVVTANGITTEVFRTTWDATGAGVSQVIHVALRSGAVSAWHQHRERWDQIMVVGGHIRLVLHDPRASSPTHGQVDVLHLSPARPTLLAIPPMIWHGVQNISGEVSTFVNMFDAEYDYADPDEWRLPPDAAEIPYRFA